MPRLRTSYWGLGGDVSIKAAVIANTMLTDMSRPNSSMEDGDQKPELEWKWTYRKRDEEHRKAASDGYPTECGNIPWHRCIIARPPQPKYTDHKAWTSEHGTVQTMLRRREAAPFFKKLRVVPLEVNNDSCSDNHSDPQTDEDESILVNSQAVPLYEDNGVRLENLH